MTNLLFVVLGPFLFTKKPASFHKFAKGRSIGHGLQTDRRRSSEACGRKENIAHFEHCSTRLRFSLIDNSKADVKRLESFSGVIAVKMTGQCQVVIRE
ncbi:hypothetical protein HMSSN036_28130 [Paenibacillus macerans]|nr:hypothetical protein HMSSN036_28130 [Paenibacillus macerans]